MKTIINKIKHNLIIFNNKTMILNRKLIIIKLNNKMIMYKIRRIIIYKIVNQMIKLKIM